MSPCHRSAPGAVSRRSSIADNPKCAYGSERAHLGTAQVVAVVADGHGLASRPSRQVEALREDVARIDSVEVARVARPSHRRGPRVGPLSACRPTADRRRRHGSPPLLLKMAPEVVVEAGRAAELAIDVRQLAARVAQEQPARDEVVRAAQIEEHEQRRPATMCRP